MMARYRLNVAGLILILLHGIGLFPAFAAADSGLAATLVALDADDIADLGNRYLKRNNPDAFAGPDSALVFFEEIVSRYDTNQENVRSETLVVALSNIAYIYSRLFNDYREAYASLMRAEKVVDDDNLVNLSSHIASNMSFVVATCILFNADETNSLEKAEANRLLAKCLKLCVGTKDFMTSAYTLLNIIDVNFPENGEFVRDGIAVYRNLGVDGGSPELRKYMDIVVRGVEAFYDKDYKESEKLFALAGELSSVPARWNKNVFFNMFPIWIRAMNDMAQSRFADCENKLLEVDSIARTTGSVEMKLSTARQLYQFYKKTGNNDKADRYLLEFYKVRDKIYGKSKIYSLADIKLKGELDENRYKVSALREERLRSRSLFVTVLSVALLLIVTLATILIYYRKRQALVMELYKKNLELLENSRRVDACRKNESSAGEGPDCASESEGGDARAITDTDRKLIARIDEIINHGDELFNPEFSLPMLCELLDSNSSYVSRAINEGFGKSFKTMVAERRIFEACRIINGKSGRPDFSVEGLGLHVGYKSRVTFTRAFKSITGLTPSAYIEAAGKLSRSDKSLLSGDDL